MASNSTISLAFKVEVVDGEFKGLAAEELNKRFEELIKAGL